MGLKYKYTDIGWNSGEQDLERAIIRGLTEIDLIDEADWEIIDIIKVEEDSNDILFHSHLIILKGTIIY